MNNMQKNFSNKSKGFHNAHGLIKGPGTTTSDSVNVKASKGEAILPAKTVKAIGGPSAVHHLIKNTTGKSPKVGLRAGAKYSVGEIPDISDVGIKKIDALPRPDVAASSSPFPRTSAAPAVAPAASPIDPTMKIPEAGAAEKPSLWGRLRQGVTGAKDAAKAAVSNVTGTAEAAPSAMDKLNSIGTKAHSVSEIVDDLAKTGERVVSGGKSAVKGAGNFVARAALPFVGETMGKLSPFLLGANAIYDVANDPNVVRGAAQGAFDVGVGLSGVAGLPVAAAEVGSRLATSALGAEINGRGMGLVQLADDLAPWQVGKVAAAKGARDLREDATMKGIKGDIDNYRSLLSRSAATSPVAVPQSVQQAISPSETMTDHNPNPAVPQGIKDRFYSDGKPPSLVPQSVQQAISPSETMTDHNPNPAVPQGIKDRFYSDGKPPSLVPAGTTPSTGGAGAGSGASTNASLSQAITPQRVMPYDSDKPYVSLPADYRTVDNNFTRRYGGSHANKGEAPNTQIPFDETNHNPIQMMNIAKHNLVNSRNLDEYLANKKMLNQVVGLDANMASRQASANTLAAQQLVNQRTLEMNQRQYDREVHKDLLDRIDGTYVDAATQKPDTAKNAQFKQFVMGGLGDKEANNLSKMSAGEQQAALAAHKILFDMKERMLAKGGKGMTNLNSVDDVSLTDAESPTWSEAVSPKVGSASVWNKVRGWNPVATNNDWVRFGGNHMLLRDLYTDDHGVIQHADMNASKRALATVKELRAKLRADTEKQGSK